LQEGRWETKAAEEEEILGKSGIEGASGNTSTALPEKPAPFEIANPVTFGTHGSKFQFSAQELEQTLDFLNPKSVSLPGEVNPSALPLTRPRWPRVEPAMDKARVQ